MKVLIVLVVAIAIADYAVLVSGACDSSQADSSIYPTRYTTNYHGDATYYGQYTNGGHCSLDPTPYVGSNSAIAATVAIADNIYDGSKACGMCINVTANGVGSGASPLSGNYLVYVNNQCPSCTASGIDFGLNGDGIWDISWKAVPCPVGSTKVQYKFQGSHTWYIKLQARNTRYPVYGIEIYQSSTWKKLVRTEDNFFLAGSSVTFPLSLPLTIKVIASTGDSFEDSIASITNDVVIDGTKQFVECGSSTSGTATTTTTAKSTTTTTTAKSTTTTTTTGKSTTTGSSTTGSSSSFSYIWADGLGSGWQDWSWATKSEATSPVFAGSKSYGFYPSSWAAAYFHCASNGCLKTATHAAIEFYINSPTKTLSTEITVGLIPNGGSAATNAVNIGTLTTTYPVPANSWTKGTLSLSTVAAGVYDGIWFQDNTGGTNAIVYLDEIKVINK